MTEIEKQHTSDLKNVQEQVKFFYSQKRKIKIYHGSTNSTRSLQYERGKVIDVSKFDRIVSINFDEKYILLEPNVPMDKLVEATLKHCLVPAKDFVQLTYHAVKSFEEMNRLIEEKTGEAVNFVDGIMFSKNSGVVMSGNFSEKQNLPISTFSKPNDEWFYLHAERISKHHEKYGEIIPTKDYLFRYDRGGFWMGKYGFSFLKMPFNRFTRFIFNSFCTTRALYRSLHSANFSQRYLIQDISLPKENVINFLEYIEKNLHTYPLWICPLKPAGQDKLSPNCLKTNLVINVGVWGEVKKDFSHFVELNRELEKFVDNLGGRKVLYAHAYYSRDEFWKIYDFEWYNALRDKYFANVTFPDIYDKTLVSREYKPTILGGLGSLIKSPFKKSLILE